MRLEGTFPPPVPVKQAALPHLLSTHEPLIRGALMGVGVFLALDFAVWAVWAVRGF